jgi:hypothetical protein
VIVPRQVFRSAFLLAALAPALSAAEPPPPGPTVALRGPDVVKLDWNTRALQVADINGDGLDDLAVANNDRSSIEFLLQLKPGATPEALARQVNANRWEPVLEDARFRKTSVTTGITVFDLFVGDLNNDGRPDLAYTGEPQALTIRYRQKDDTWIEKKINEAPAPIQLVGSIEIADLDGDKRADFAMLGQKELAIFRQGKDGQLGAPERYALPDDNCYGLEVTDVNADGRPDLVYLCGNSRDPMRVRLQTASRQFGPEQPYTMRETRCTLQILAPATAKTPAVFAFAQENTGQFEEFRFERAVATAASSPVMRPRVFSPRSGGKTPAAYALGDFDGDGREDVAVSDPEGAQIYVYLRNPDGGFTTGQRFPAFADCRSLTAADWNGDGQADLIVASPREQSVGVATFAAGRLNYPQALPITGKPLALAAGDIAGDGRTLLALVREEKGRRLLELWARKDDSAELVKAIELTGIKTDPRALRLFDANQDGVLDLAVFTPLDAVRLLIQGKTALEFTDITTLPGFRRGLVDNLDASVCTFADVDGDGKDELIAGSSGFSRALRVNAKNELVVVDQFNAREPAAEIASTLVLPGEAGKRPLIVLYDRKAEQFQTLRAGEQNLFQVVDSAPAGRIDVVSSEVRTRKGGGAEAFIFGKDRFWWLPVGSGDFSAVTVATHATDLPEIGYSDIVAGDLNNDGKLEVVCVDPHKHLIEVLGRGADNRWESRLHFKVFETDEHYQGRKGPPLEPRETMIADVTGDGKKDLILLVHDRVLVYPQE